MQRGRSRPRHLAPDDRQAVPGRLAFGLRRPRNPVPGLDVAGTVVAVGSAVTRFASATRSTASHAAPSPSTPWPVRTSWPASRRTSPSTGRRRAGLGRHRAAGPHRRRPARGRADGAGHRRVRRRRQLRRPAGQGARGGGHRRLQHRKLDLVRSLGADHVLDYTRDDFADGTPPLRPGPRHRGKPALSRLRRALTPHGTRSSSAGEDGGNVLRRHEPSAAGRGPVAVRAPAADDVRRQGSGRPTWNGSPSSSRPAR